MDFPQGRPQDVSNSSLTSPDTMAPSVYNHTLLSPRQVSINQAMLPHLCSGLIGGFSCIGDRVIENLAADPSAIRGKDDVSNCKITFNNDSFFPDILATPIAINQNKLSKGKSSCTFTSQTIGQAPKTTAEEEKEDDDDGDSHDSNSDNDEDDDQEDTGIDVEDFIEMHLSKKQQMEVTDPEEKEMVPTAGKDIKNQTMESFLQKTDELIQCNLLLQQQISNLKKETAKQTKILTKLLGKSSKNHQKKPYSNNAL